MQALAETEESSDYAALLYVYDDGGLEIIHGDLPTGEVKVYTAAPPRRKPLSDEAIRSAIAAYKKANKLLGVNHRHVSRAIEAAHGIGGKE